MYMYALAVGLLALLGIVPVISHSHLHPFGSDLMKHFPFLSGVHLL